MEDFEARLKELGLSLPEIPPSAGAYVPAVQSGNLIFCSGHSAPEFHDQPKVVNGASELVLDIFGDAGKHARCALGTSNLPMNIPVEIEMVVEIETK